MTPHEQEASVINQSFERIVDDIYTNFITLYAGSTNDQEREITKATFQRQILEARAMRNLALSLLPA